MLNQMEAGRHFLTFRTSKFKIGSELLRSAHVDIFPALGAF